MNSTNMWKGTAQIYGLSSPITNNTWSLNFVTIPGLYTPNLLRFFQDKNENVFEKLINQIKDIFTKQGINDGETVYIKYIHTRNIRKTIIKKIGSDKRIVINSVYPFKKNTVKVL